jgi:hypothetical protein
MKQATFSPAYVAVYPMLSELARSHGYALAIHGSVVHDFDLVACPWTEEASDPLSLYDAIVKWLDSRQCILEGSKLKEPEQKSHGRLAWSIPTGNGSVIDLSIMPRSIKLEIELT